MGDAKRIDGHLQTWLLSLGGGHHPRTMPLELAIGRGAYLHQRALDSGGAWAGAVLVQRDGRGPGYFTDQRRGFARKQQDSTPEHTGHMAVGTAIVLFPLRSHRRPTHPTRHSSALSTPLSEGSGSSVVYFVELASSGAEFRSPV